jgi:hypothetical protein
MCPIVATSMYPPPAAARKKSTPIPAVTMVPAVFFHPGCSVVNNRRSASVSRPLPSSRKCNLPGPQVGKVDNEQMILPPLDANAANAAFSAGNNAGSGFLIVENMVGID